MNQLDADVCALEQLVKNESLTADEQDVFLHMLDRLRRGRGELSAKQRSWALDVCTRLDIDPDPRERAERTKDVPRGKEVPTPAVLRALPKSPLGRRRSA